MFKFDWESKRKIEEIIDQIASSRIKKFYPTIIHKLTELPLNQIFNFLLDMVEDGRLILKWEIRCTNYDCSVLLIRTDNIKVYMSETVNCGECDNEIEVNESIVFPVFEINNQYKDRLGEFKKKEKNLLKAL